MLRVRNIHIMSVEDLVKRRYDSIPPEFRFTNPPENPSKWYREHLAERQIDIVELDATGLAEEIAKGKYSALEVTEAYLKSAAVAHAATNCLVWFDPEGARAQAKALDEEFNRTGSTVGPLHGVPMSIKGKYCVPEDNSLTGDMVQVKGYPMSGGTVASAGYVPDEDVEMVAIFRRAGIVTYCKTNMPQSVMQLETSSYMGTTTNAYNRNLTSGGSSGGEGALVACHGSPWGITTDIGGSTRNPGAL